MIDRMLRRWTAGGLRATLQLLGPRLQVISFDVFDTVLQRRIPSSEVSAAQAARVARLLLGGGNDAVLRVQAHRWAWEQDLAARARRAPVEASLAEWAECLAADLGLDRRRAVDVAEETWLWCESRANRRDDRLWGVIRDGAAAYGLRTAAISDGWASQDRLRELLASFGVLPDAVFASATAGVSKRHGGLFEHVYGALDVAPTAMLHVGDNLEADVARAALRGTPAVLLPQRSSVGRRRVRTGPDRAFTLARLFADAGEQRLDSVESFAETVLAPLVAVWDLAVRRNVARQASDVRVYCARDGYLPFRWAAQADSVLGAPAPAAYVRLSRRVVGLLHPARLLESVPGLAGRAGRARVFDILQPFDLPDALRDAILADANLAGGDVASEDARARLVAAAWKHRHEVEAERRDRIELVVDYLREAIGDRRRWMFVDVGWAGTTQDVLATLPGMADRVDATYLGVSKTYPIGANAARFGLLRDESTGAAAPARPSESLGASLRIWEVLLREGTGTAQRLVRTVTGAVEPSLSDADPRHTALARRVEQGMDAGWERLQSRVELAAELLPLLTDADLRVAARELTARFAWRPGSALATDLLAVGYDEASGRTRSLGVVLQDPRDVWWPGVLARLRG
ncbi:MAG: hypothetical protein H6697_10405 [Myxococcales bacterium]|nr:hypothetical protein [Myxococcales bacterium]